VPEANPQESQLTQCVTPPSTRLVLGPQFMRVYANTTRFGASINDMSMFFGEAFLVGPGEITTEERVCVTLSLPQAKILAGYLAANLLFHEIYNDSIIQPQKGSFTAQFAGVDTKLPVDQLIAQICEIVRAGSESAKR